MGTNHAKILTGLKDKNLCSKLAESNAKKWNNMAQVLQDITEMAVSFKRSRGYSLPSFEINQATAYSNHHPSNNQNYNVNKQYSKETQHSHPKPERLKCWECQDEHLKKDCPKVKSRQSKPKHHRFQEYKEKQCKLLKFFLKKFFNKKESVNEKWMCQK